jgi:bifunctional pyridoxal-dependent enzyme with beta-cystathionase and maltose regulon repressor activities
LAKPFKQLAGKYRSDIDERTQPVKCETTKHLKTFQKCYLLSSAKNPTGKVHYHGRRRRRRRRRGQKKK